MRAGGGGGCGGYGHNGGHGGNAGAGYGTNGGTMGYTGGDGGATGYNGYGTYMTGASNQFLSGGYTVSTRYFADQFLVSNTGCGARGPDRTQGVVASQTSYYGGSGAATLIFGMNARYGIGHLTTNMPVRPFGFTGGQGTEANTN